MPTRVRLVYERLLPHRRLWSRPTADTGDLLTGFTTDSSRVEEAHDLSHKPGTRCDRGARQEDARPPDTVTVRQCGLRRRAIRHSLFAGSGGFMAELRADPRRPLRYACKQPEPTIKCCSQGSADRRGTRGSQASIWRLWAPGRSPAVCQVPSIDQGGTSACHTSHIHANRGAISSVRCHTYGASESCPRGVVGAVFRGKLREFATSPQVTGLRRCPHP